jgi:hypothetical protein
MVDLGDIEELDPRTIWPKEAHDFTPWLASNLDRLADALGMDLELVDTEVPVGPFSIDLVAKEVGTDRIVAVENQLEITDHDHLGKVLTYAAGVEAHYAVWIAKGFRPEHLSAIGWINDSTVADVGFFALRVEAIRIDGSKPAVTLRPVAYPDSWSKQRKGTSGGGVGLTERQQLYQQFWSEVLEGIHQRWPTWTRSKTPAKDSWMSLPSGRSGIAYNLAFTNDPGLRIELYVDPYDEQLREVAWVQLDLKRDLIEGTLGKKLSWEELPTRRASRIGLYLDQPASVDRKEEWATYRSFLLDNLGDFRDALQPRVDALGAASEPPILS